MQRLKETEEGRSAGKSPQALKEVRKTLADFSKLQTSADFSSPGPWHPKGELPQEIQNPARSQGSLPPNLNIGDIMSSSINPDSIFEKGQGNREETKD